MEEVRIMLPMGRIIICLLLGYCFGMIPNGYLYCKARGVDIYGVGSGNPGSTNVLRTLGPRAGVTVLLLDIAKTLLPILILHMLWKPADPDTATMITLYTGIGAILGHNFPVIPGLKGGKGVACTGALCLALCLPQGICLFLLFLAIAAATRYVSLASCTAVSMLFVSTLLLGKTGLLPFTPAIYGRVCILTFLVAALCVFQHRSNIRRLMNGTENKLGAKKQ